MTVLEDEKTKAEIRLALAQAEAQELENRSAKALPHTRGEFTLVGAVDENSAHFLIEKLSRWSSSHPGEPVTIFINSEGGNIFDGFALFDYIRHLKNIGHHVTMQGVGMQASMGGILLQAGHDRVMSPLSWLLIHEVQGITAGALSEMKDGVKLNQRFQSQALDILAERSTMSKTSIKNKWARKDWWLSADEALKYGFIDRIG